MSRSRLLKPGFFVDANLGRVSRDSRLAFGGICTEADDQGYFEWQPEELAWSLFRYDADKREVIDQALLELGSVGVIEQLPCRIHGLIDSMPEHRIQGGNHSSNVERQHQRHCLSGRVRTDRDAPAVPPRPDESVPVRTPKDTLLAEHPVRTSPDASLSESVSESLKGRREKKNVLEEGVEIRDEAREPATPVEPAPHLTFPSVSFVGRPDASPTPVPSTTLTVALEALTPNWGNTCRSYIAHQMKHVIRDGVGWCPICLEEDRARSTPAQPNGVEHGAPQELGL